MAKARRNYVATEQFYVETELAKAKRNYVATEKFYVEIELARVGRISVAIEDFYVAMELVTTESFVAHDRARRVKAGVHDSMASCCVVIEEAMHARQIRPGAHDRGASAVGEFYRDREFFVTTDLDSDEKRKKKKKDPWDLERHIN